MQRNGYRGRAWETRAGRIELDRILSGRLGASSVVLDEQLNALLHPIDRLHAISACEVAAGQNEDEGDEKCGEERKTTHQGPFQNVRDDNGGGFWKQDRDERRAEVASGAPVRPTAGFTQAGCLPLGATRADRSEISTKSAPEPATRPAWENQRRKPGRGRACVEGVAEGSPA